MEPLLCEIPFLDPLRAFAALRDLPAPLLLDSARLDPRLGRWSFVAADPFLFLSSRDGRIRLDGERRTGDPWLVLERCLARFRLPFDPASPVPFRTGVAGWIGFEAARHLERLPAAAGDDPAFPDLELGFYDTIAAFDLRERRGWIASSGFPERTPEARLARRRARLELFRERLARAPELPPPDPRPVPRPASNFTRPGFAAAVRKAIDYVLAGDVFQVNLARRFTTALPEGLDPFDLYRRLRRVNPAPMAAFLDFGETVIASASPERFLRLLGGRVETRPIKGTRPRGRTPEQDAALARELLESEKDRAENVMIVDLLRNDLSRVCRPHSVRVPELCVLERHPTVFHLVSTVVGTLEPGRGPLDLLRASFPGGSITGAPKIRAIEIVAELEPDRRGPYCGTILWIGFDGAMDSAIAIRTFAIRGRTLTFAAGGGITALSDPEAEYAETEAKAEGLLRALAGEGAAP
ncbi:MAG: aminodeoxychorismate synthase component I [Geminicoccaceae bacterium]|nr:aminodeoxychorismate synthase component I [Geminicoccaceae bacterium]MDW8125377.1 aminodeoxychorismate synthase component I [Geminicoccaceae bacterium]MDW8342104.1 aminodeoxychorismate synthase component I [Geminicoccaceae bacterium]MDW8444059.1 aminodeoxychorismate synthase component I [Acetobacteraceae bacterium]